MWLDWFTNEIPEGNTVGYLNAVELPAGDYEFYTYEGQLYLPNGGTVTYFPRKEFSWKFKVEAGTANYLGNVNICNIDFINKIITLNDERERDFRLFKEKYKNIDVNEIKITLLQKSPGDIIPMR